MDHEITPLSTATAVGLCMATGFYTMASATSFSAVPAFLLPRLDRSSTSETASTAKSKPRAIDPDPSQLLRQWKSMWDNGKKAGPFLSAIGAVSYLYAASLLPSSKTRARRLYVVAAFCSIGVIPFTFAFMKKWNDVLFERLAIVESGGKLPEETGNQGQEQTTMEIVRHWAGLNAIRAVIPLLGVACIITANL